MLEGAVECVLDATVVGGDTIFEERRDIGELSSIRVDV